MNMEAGIVIITLCIVGSMIGSFAGHILWEILNDRKIVKEMEDPRNDTDDLYLDKDGKFFTNNVIDRE